MPACPYELGDAGSAWWGWAWSTPQAKRWDDGVLYVLARRAVLEDLVSALAEVDELSVEAIDRLINGDPATAGQRFGWLLRKLKSAAGSFTELSREMRELEGQLGFGAKSMASLGWKVEEEKPKGSKLDELRARRDKKVGGATA